MRIAATILILTAAVALASPWQMVIARKKANAGGGSGLPNKTDLVAWWDFDDATASSPDGVTWTETGSPSYSGGVVTISSGNTLSGNTLTDGTTTWAPDASTDCTVAARINQASANNGAYWFRASNVREHIQYLTSGTYCRMHNVTDIESTVVGAMMTVVVVTFDSATGEVQAYVGGTSGGATTGSLGATAGIDATLGTSLSSGSMSLDYLGLWNRKLTTNEIAALSTAGSIEYGDLP